MLDLRTFIDDEPFEMVWIDGTILKIGLISQKVLRTMTDAVSVSKNAKETIDMSNKIVLMILNNNQNGLVFKLDDIEEKLTTEMVTAIITDYSQYVSKKLGE